MNTLKRKLISGALSVTTTIWLSGALAVLPVAHGQLDIQAQINALLAQIALLQSQLAGLQGGTSGSGAACTFTRNLTVGTTGDDVLCLQKYLNGAGHTIAASGSGSPGNETRFFGSLTRAAAAKWQAANGVSPAVGYFGSISQAKYRSLAGGGTGPGPIVIPGSGLVLALAFDNPASMGVPRGATGVTFMKFTVSGNGTLDAMTFKREGIGATGDFASNGAYLYEGDKRLTNGKNINSTTHEINFVNLALQVAGTRTLSLVVDTAAGATAANQNFFSLVSAAGTPTPTGTLKGNTLTIAGQTVGGIVADDQSAPANPKIGQMAAPLLEFQLTASSTEDILIQRLSLTEAGTINNDHLSNFVLKQGGNTVATAAKIGAKDLVTLNFTTPFLLEKGQNRNFVLEGDVSGLARADDTIAFYFDTKADIIATGKIYGYPVLPTIDNIDTSSETDTLTVQGGEINITFNGPIKGNIALRAQDVTVFDFTMASKNNIEIKNLRFHATTTGITSNSEGFNDFKLWDATSNSVISSATDVTTTSLAITVTDIINIGAGQTKRMRITVDVDADNAAGDDILVSLRPFQSNDIRSLDNNTFVATSSIVPDAIVAGNVQDTVAPALTVQLAGTPQSDSIVKGTKNVPFVGFSFRAGDDDVKITSITLSASGSNATGTVARLTGEVQNVALYDGATRISDFKSITGATPPATAVFSNMNYVIAKGNTKIITARADLSSVATVDAGYSMFLNATSDISVVDSQSNTVNPGGTTANSGLTIAVTVLNSGDVTVAAAAIDAENKNRLVIAGNEEVLGKFKFTAVNEPMTINKLDISVIDSASTSATSTATIDEVAVIKLYEQTGLTLTQIGAPTGYPIISSGISSGIATIESLGWTIGKNQDKTLVVRAPINAIDINSTNQSDAGTSLFVNMRSTGFESVGTAALDTSIGAAGGVTGVNQRKVVVRGRPTVTWLPLDSKSLVTNSKIAKFRVAAGAVPIQFKTFQLKVDTIGVHMSAPTISGVVNLKVFNLTKDANNELALATVVSGAATSTTGIASITAGSTGFVTITFTNAEEVAANSSFDYQVQANFVNISGTVGASKAIAQLNLPEGTATTASAYATVSHPGSNGVNGFVWSDFSKVLHSETTADWLHGFLTELPVSASWEVNNN